ncbi:pyridoxal phosphate-dependent aminotransferase [uncultured Campylobacter sp.]|uniref:pyridoxal phosphate-dependent aminotransferase n=1 Tax=uncultured Campylobacter sp. TaxID=218934 RepID=UPI00260628A6|nr:pyridoxal phosphate-dependent aminotransferase [uncultured Campylobacter sp.]
MKLTLSSRVSKLGESLTIAISTKAKQMKAQGQDVVILSAGEPDFDTAEVAKRAVIEAMAKGCGKYTPVAGTPEILNLIAQKLKRDNDLDYRPDQIITNVGAKHSLFNAFNCILNEGDEVIISAPYWVTYPEIVKFCGSKPVIVATKAENRYKITASQLKAAITPRTKALCLFNPSNPAGAVYSRQELQELADVLKGTKILVIADEIYEKIVFGKSFIAAASISEDMFRRTVTINGLSKCGAMPGWRFGYTACAIDELNKAMINLQSQSVSNVASIVQAGAMPVLRGEADDFIEEMRREYERRRDFGTDAIGAIPGLSVVKPDGAFYFFIDCSQVEPDSMKFCMQLLDKGLVATVPGSGFGMDGHFRVSFACSMENLKRGFERIKKFVKNYHR